MKTRRQFIKLTMKFLAGVGLLFGIAGSVLRKAWAQAGRILLPRGTDLSTRDTC